MSCLTGKHRYPDKRTARVALADISQRQTAHRRTNHIYRCPSCNGWHLTSRGTPRPA
ncbi:hypothetical protein ACIREK_31075 [Streptomyces sp. NPDC102415]|uniref:hypothetical protein n=1 Tax=Streptomyces sp. NPDC102415 TaxID=3366173 RepID=UPI00382700F4